MGWDEIGQNGIKWDGIEQNIPLWGLTALTVKAFLLPPLPSLPPLSFHPPAPTHYNSRRRRAGGARPRDVIARGGAGRRSGAGRGGRGPLWAGAGRAPLRAAPAGTGSGSAR